MEDDMTTEDSYDKKSFWHYLLPYLVIGGIIYVGIYYFSPKTTPTPQPTPSPTISAVTTNENMIDLTDAGYSPSTITIAVGDVVTWTNKSAGTATVSSDDHPTHTKYAPLNLGKFEPGSTHSLNFDTAGTYTYHNHLNATQVGTIIVK